MPAFREKTKSTATKISRPPIPEKTQLRLWVLAGGRCEFPGCNEFLLQDTTTLSQGNYSNIAHIISWTPTGPRGDAELSPKLGADMSNLMLMCQRHAKMIDDKGNFSIFTTEYLRKCKEDHESRIRIQTDIHPDRKTTVLRLQSNIRGRRVDIPQSDTYNALIASGRYPRDEKGVHIDLTSLDYSKDSSSWQTATRQIDSALTSGFTIGNDERKKHHLSVFGLAPIPVLAYLGFKLGNTMPADIYIKLREKPWAYQTLEGKLKFEAIQRGSKGKVSDVGLSISISGTIPTEEMSAHVGEAPVYEIRLGQAKVDQIESATDLESFRKIYRETVDVIREAHGKDCRIHLFGAIPTCAAIVCGRELLHGVDPTVILYEHADQGKGFLPAITINQ